MICVRMDIHLFFCNVIKEGDDHDKFNLNKTAGNPNGICGSTTKNKPQMRQEKQNKNVLRMSCMLSNERTYLHSKRCSVNVGYEMTLKLNGTELST